jgi:peroxiredoxin Q/BCP
MPLKENDKAPIFELPDQDGKVRSLLDWAGKWLLVYFYPKDDTPGCTKEACSLQSRLPDFSKNDLNVVGISIDGVASHKKFAEKFKLTFPLLSDEHKEVVELYGVWGKKSFMGKEHMGVIRSSFLINPQGHIARIYPKVDPVAHAEEVWQDLRVLTV